LIIHITAINSCYQTVRLRLYPA